MLKILLTVVLLGSCRVGEQDRVVRAIENSHRLLTDKKCGEALEELDKVGYRWKNAQYLSSYASAQACRAGFSEPHFFSRDLGKITAETSQLLGSLTLMSSSVIEDSSDDGYRFLQQAIDTLLYAGRLTAPSHANRVEVLGEADTRDLETQALYMLLAQLGKYFYLYGNTDENGAKGARNDVGNNDCLTDYTSLAGQLLFAGLNAEGSIAPCSAVNDGHRELAANAPDRKKRLCRGVVLYNSFLDIVPNLVFQGSNAGSLKDLNGAIENLCGNLGLATLCVQKKQKECEENESVEDLEVYFISIFETMLQGNP